MTRAVKNVVHPCVKYFFKMIGSESMVSKTRELLQ